MFLFKKKTPPADLSWLLTDVHSHLLPGIDDGAPDIGTSLDLIKGLEQLGYKKLITTPHILWEIYPNSIEAIQNKAQEVQKAVHDANINIEVRAAAEYFMDEHFSAELKSKKPLLRLSGNLVLVEFSMLSAPFDLQEVLFEMQMQNYQPVIAHPERYSYLVRRKELFDDLKTSGCWFQLNLMSLSGYYGAQVKELAEYLLKKNYYDLAGTDLHHAKHLAQLQKLPAAPIKQLQDSGTIKNHLL